LIICGVVEVCHVALRLCHGVDEHGLELPRGGAEGVE
jgi:hypothetical protein